MATKINLVSGSAFIGNPIQVRVTASTVSSYATFHRVRLKVTAALSTGSEQQEFPLFSPVDNGGMADFDISDALRSVVASYSYSPVTSATSYPYITYTLQAYDEYMLYGTLYTHHATVTYGATLYALMGSFTDLERLMAASDTPEVQSFSRKPSSGEVYAPGDTVVYPLAATPIGIDSEITAGPSCSVRTLAASEGSVSVGGRTVYVDDDASGRVLFQFVNLRGVVETASAEMLEKLETEGEYETDVRTAVHTFRDVNRMMVRKSDRYTVIKASTGYVTPEWAAWWHDELLGSDLLRNALSPNCWIRWNGTWLPCSVTANDADIYDKSEEGLVCILFDVRLPFAGLPPLS